MNTTYPCPPQEPFEEDLTAGDLADLGNLIIEERKALVDAQKSQEKAAEVEKARQDNAVALTTGTNDVGGVRPRERLESVVVGPVPSPVDSPTYARKKIASWTPGPVSSSDTGGYRDRRKV